MYFCYIVKKGGFMFYWTLFLILTPENNENKKEYIEIISFNERINCESSIISEKVIYFKHFKGELKCLKTDERVGVDYRFK